MKCVCVFLFFIVLGGSWRLGRATCVLESEFGFKINCAFKKSGLFRVRNLGGIKAHVGLGFSLGDELGFAESISNVEFNKRRSSQASGFQVALTQQQQQKQQALANRITVRAPPQRTQSPMTPTASQAAKPAPPQIGNIPPFKPIPPAPERPVVAMPLNNSKQKVAAPAIAGVAVPAFQVMPSSISRVSAGPTIAVDRVQSKNTANDRNDKLNSNNLSLRTLQGSSNELPPPLPVQSTNSIQALASASNISVEALEAALLLRQQHLMHQNAPAAVARKPAAPPAKNVISSASKVMNAPKEYYPVGYDKNFDDNFASRVELPDTSFYCGDQKHFPGLYADEDLGCMVFHVCALTDDGLIMKSFLCPESTLFDQTILKCNWWFYVDCKNSKKLYDSNIPISKSYQLMKALTFFSAYKNSQNGPARNATGKAVV